MSRMYIHRLGEAFSSIPGTDKKKGQGFVCEPGRYKELLELPGLETERIVFHAKPGVLRPIPCSTALPPIC